VLVALEPRLVLPCPPAHGAALLRAAGQPLVDALDVEGMLTHAPNDWAVVAWVLAIRRAAVKGTAADTTHIIASVPRPRGHAVPLRYADAEHCTPPELPDCSRSLFVRLLKISSNQGRAAALFWLCEISVNGQSKLCNLQLHCPLIPCDKAALI